MTDPEPQRTFPINRPNFSRLRNYNYSQPGHYFVTLVAAFRESVFGRIEEDRMILSPIGEIIREEWLRSPQIRREIELGVFVIMPNHFHGIVQIVPTLDNDELLRFQTHCRARLPETSQRLNWGKGPQNSTEDPHCRARLQEVHPYRTPRSLGSFIAGFKSYSTKLINQMRETPGARVWQPDYFDCILHTTRALENADRYILSNVVKWATDKENPLCSK